MDRGSPIQPSATNTLEYAGKPLSSKSHRTIHHFYNIFACMPPHPRLNSMYNQHTKWTVGWQPNLFQNTLRSPKCICIPVHKPMNRERTGITKTHCLHHTGTEVKMHSALRMPWFLLNVHRNMVTF